MERSRTDFFSTCCRLFADVLASIRWRLAQTQRPPLCLRFHLRLSLRLRRPLLYLHARLYPFLRRPPQLPLHLVPTLQFLLMTRIDARVLNLHPHHPQQNAHANPGSFRTSGSTLVLPETHASSFARPEYCPEHTRQAREEEAGALSPLKVGHLLLEFGNLKIVRRRGFYLGIPIYRQGV